MIQRVLRWSAGTSVSATLMLALGACSSGRFESSPAPGSSSTFTNSGIPSWATADRYAGRLEANEPVSVQVHLRLRDMDGARAELAAISDPESLQYGRFLSDAELEAKYLPTADDVAAVRAHLEAQGLTVVQVPGNRAFVEARGAAAKVEKAFATRLARFQVGTELRQAPLDAPALPQALSSRVSSILGLATPAKLRPATMRRPAPPGAVNTFGGLCSEWYGQNPDTTDPAFAPGYPSPLAFAPCGYRPAQLRQAYGFDALVKKGNDGQGQTIAVLEDFASPTVISDAQTYAAANDADYPLAASQITVVHAPGTPVTPPCSDGDGWYEEQTLDVEALHAIAPGAKIVVESADGEDDTHVLSALNDIVANKRASLISNSWSGIENGMFVYVPYESVAIQAGLKGIGMYFATGDHGDWVEASLPYHYPPSIPFPASLSEVTAVGGTSLALGRDGSRLWETGWETAASYQVPADFQGTWPVPKESSGCSGLPSGSGNPFTGDAGTESLVWWPSAPGGFLFGAGGGTSILYVQPKYQAGIVPASVSNLDGAAARVVPDVAMLGDPITGFLWGDSSTGTYEEIPIGGTSLATPLFTATIALAQQKAGKHFGSINALLYKASKSGAFRDVAPVPDQAAAMYPGSITTFDYHGPENSLASAKGFDNVTGLGVPNGAKFFDAVK